MKELIIDLKGYKEDAKVWKRTAARGIVIKDGTYLIIHSKYGDYKFPGGGRKEGESLEDTLVREVQEETGYHVITDSITSWLKVLEKRKGEQDEILEMDSHYFFCQVEEVAGSRNLDDYEAEYDYQVEWLPLEELIQKNEAVENFEKIPWVKREHTVMQMLQQFSQKSERL